MGSKNRNAGTALHPDKKKKGKRKEKHGKGDMRPYALRLMQLRALGQPKRRRSVLETNTTIKKGRESCFSSGEAVTKSGPTVNCADSQDADHKRQTAKLSLLVATEISIVG